MQFKDFLPKITESEYRLIDRVSYSFLKVFSERGPGAIIEAIPEITGDGLTLGTIVDNMLSDPTYNLHSEYKVIDINIDFSGGTHLSKIYSFLKSNRDIILVRDDMDTLQRIFSILEFKRNPSIDEEFWKCVEQINIMNSGVKILSSSEAELAETMANSFLTHRHTSAIFNPELDVEVLNQVSIMINVNGVECKILIDKMLVNHKLKKILMYDIKTGTPSDFMKNFFSYKYYYQGSFYYNILKRFLLSIPELSDYTIVNGFSFIYVSRDNPYIPFIYNMDEQYIQYVFDGYTTLTGVRIKGIKELLEDYLWHKKNEIYNLPKEIYQNNGVIKIQTPNIWKEK